MNTTDDTQIFEALGISPIAAIRCLLATPGGPIWLLYFDMTQEWKRLGYLSPAHFDLDMGVTEDMLKHAVLFAKRLIESDPQHRTTITPMCMAAIIARLGPDDVAHMSPAEVVEHAVAVARRAQDAGLNAISHDLN